MSFDKLWIGTSWKINKVRAEARSFARTLADSDLAYSDAAQLFVIPPFTAVADVADVLTGTRVAVGVQNLHWAEAGPWTGEISGAMAADCGATLAEIGHSERRAHFCETDQSVARKVAAALRHALTPLVCVGDTRDEYEAGRTAEVLDRQVRAAVSHVRLEDVGRVVLAYEPVWAIGEGGIPAEPAFADEQHAFLKASLREVTGHEVRVLYGAASTKVIVLPCPLSPTSMAYLSVAPHGSRKVTWGSSAACSLRETRHVPSDERSFAKACSRHAA